MISARLANKTAKNQPKVVVPIKRPIVTILAPNIAPNTSIQSNIQGPSARGSSITVKKEIIASNAKVIPDKELAIAKETALALNLESKCSLAGDLFAEKKDSPLEDGADHPVFKLHIDHIMSK
ncbi:hypothetical protein RclHR1_19370005 [Rhizophagus clarus]|uniref:Uncharacterized protein n=1 Tax=Rhizophagus clarus TaxID=94130 RepID=A0A2Z6R2P8_9GLOM|nr:hypothetical protein RclHR1_19370005 [Rhizophagus clarus]GES91279.1 hypothetical protein RCL_jg2396.t1 [Rhizophagus clarus]